VKELKIGYARVSTAGQDLTAQREALAGLGVDPKRVEEGAAVDPGTGQGERDPVLGGQGRVLQAELAGDLRGVGVHLAGGGQPLKEGAAIDPAPLRSRPGRQLTTRSSAGILAVSRVAGG